MLCIVWSVWAMPWSRLLSVPPATEARFYRLLFIVEMGVLLVFAGFGTAAVRDMRGRRRQPGYVFFCIFLGGIVALAELVLTS